MQFTASPTVKCVQSIRRVFTVCACNVFTVAADRSHAARRHPAALILQIRDDANDEDEDDDGDEDESENDEDESEDGDLTIGIERVASARIVPG